MNKNVIQNRILPLLLLLVSFCFSAASVCAQTSYVMPNGGGNASSSGDSTGKKQDMGAMMNIAAGTMYGGICASSCPKGGGCWACPMVPLAMMAAKGMGKASGQSGAAGFDMAGFDPSLGYGGGAGGNAPGIDPATGQPVVNGSGQRLPDGSTDIAKGIQNLKDQLNQVGVGISPDGKTITTPDGRKFDISNGGGKGSKEDLMAMGLTPSEVDAAQSASGKFAKDYASKFAQMKQLDGASGSGGAGGGRSVAADGSGGGGGAGGFGGWDRDPRNRNARNKNKISGLTKKFGDDTIGVSGDNIFEMVTRRYKARDEKNDFLKD